MYCTQLDSLINCHYIYVVAIEYAGQVVSLEGEGVTPQVPKEP